MKFGVANISIVPMRKEPSAESEMVSQVLFGEHFEVLEEKNGWLKVSHYYDNYIGWIDKRMYHEIPREQKELLDAENKIYALDLTNLASKNHSTFPVVYGSVLPMYDKEHNNFKVYPKGYHISGKVGQACAEGELPKRIADTAFNYLNAPYLWGGRTPFGIDCSGFTQMVYKLNNVKIPRDSSQQIKEGVKVPLEEARQGDLAFFSQPNSDKVSHVGIILDNNEIIHASGTVHVDHLDQTGILCKNEGITYTHKLIEIRRIAN